MKYLGVKLETTSRWIDNTNYESNKVSSRLGYMRRTILPSLPNLRLESQILHPPSQANIGIYSSYVCDGSLTQTQFNRPEPVKRRDCNQHPSHGSHHKDLKPYRAARIATNQHQKRTQTPRTLQCYPL